MDGIGVEHDDGTVEAPVDADIGLIVDVFVCEPLSAFLLKDDFISNCDTVAPGIPWEYKVLSLVSCFSVALFSTVALSVPGDARASGDRVYFDRLVVTGEPQAGLEYKYHMADPEDNFCFEGGLNCAIVVFDPDPVNSGDEEIVAYTY